MRIGFCIAHTKSGELAVYRFGCVATPEEVLQERGILNCRFPSWAHTVQHSLLGVCEMLTCSRSPSGVTSLQYLTGECLSCVLGILVYVDFNMPVFYNCSSKSLFATGYCI